jgi:hypothetical protein
MQSPATIYLLNRYLKFEQIMAKHTTLLVKARYIRIKLFGWI